MLRVPVGVQTCSLSLISLIDLKFISTSFCNPYFVEHWLAFIIFIVSEFIDPETSSQVC